MQLISPSISTIYQYLQPFRAEELYIILWTLLETFVTTSVLDQAATAAKLSKIDVLNKENLLSPKKVDVGFACKILLQEAQAKKKASPLHVLECIVLLHKLRNKLLEHCPLQYAIFRQLTCMDPRYMAKNPDSAISKCSGLLQQLISKKTGVPRLVRHYPSAVHSFVCLQLRPRS